MAVHPTAVIDGKAKLGTDVEVGAYAVIGPDVTLGNGVVISPSCHLQGRTSVGDGTFIGPGAVIGAPPQMLGVRNSLGNLKIGKNNIIREYVTIHVSTAPDKATTIGDNNFFMGFSHLAHDCSVGNNVVICNGALIAGHVHIADRAFISGNVVVHQFVRIGRLAMIGGLARVNQDVPPFVMVVGDSCVVGLNLIGLKRAGFTPQERADIKKAFDLFYRQGHAQTGALAQLQQLSSRGAQEIAGFIKTSERGVCGSRKNPLWQKIFLEYPYFVRTAIPTYRLFRKYQKRSRR